MQKIDSQFPIGIFDSGVGGFTVLKELKKQMPAEQFLYYGDTKNIPYGEKTPELIRKWALNAIEFLLSLKVKAIAVGCNVSSSVLREQDLKKSPVPIFPLIPYGVRSALRKSQRKKIGVIATSATLKARTYERCVSSIASGVELIQVACPRFVPLTEMGITAGQDVEEVALSYLTPLLDAHVDTIIYGCTHFPLLSKVIRKHVDGISLVDPAVSMAKAVRARLNKYGLLRAGRSEPDIFFVSRETEGFFKVAKEFLKKDIRANTRVWVINE